MIIAVLGILDMVAGLLLTLCGFSSIHSNIVLLIVAIAMGLKGFWSWINNLTAGFKLDFMGILDLVVALMLFLTFSGFPMFFFVYFGILSIIKGAYSLLVGLIKS